MKEKVRYLPGLRTFIGFRQGYVEFIREDRYKGEPKMSIRKLFMLAADAIFSFSRFPIRFCLILGTIGTLVFMGAGIYVLIAKVMWICCNRLVINSSEYLFSGIHSACFSWDSW